MLQGTPTRTRWWWVLTLLALLVMACSLTSPSLKSAIIGRWQQAGETGETGETLEFYQDGTMTAESLGLTVTGNYEFIDDDTIRIEMTGLLGLAGAQVADVSISGDTLTLTISGTSTSYTRVK